jgi:catechol 2,3-dioxygenase-like lactoylglutathione lyase family enzyme
MVAGRKADLKPRGGDMRGFLAAIALTTLTAIPIAAQAPAPEPNEPPHVVSLSHFIHATNKLETTIAFYRDVFGLTIPEPRQFANQGAALLNNVPGLGLRLSMARFSDGFGFELTEFSNVDRKGGQGLATDPGAVQLILPVRSVDQVLANAKKAGAEIISKSDGTAGPVEITTPKGKTRALIVRDVDGYLVRAYEVPAAEATLPGLVQPGVSLALAVKDMAVTEKFYRDVVGMPLTGDLKFARDKAMAGLFGAPANSEYRMMSAPFPNTKSQQEFYEWKGMKRTPFELRVPDPGAGGWVARVSDLETMFKQMKAHNVKTVTPEPIWFTKTTWDIFIFDPDGMHLELFQNIPAPDQKPTN